MNLAALKELITLPSLEWKDISPSSDEVISMCKIVECSKISHCITINSDCSWEVFVYGQKIHPEHSPVLNEIPSKVDWNSASRFLELIDTSTICCGNNDGSFVGMIAERKGKNVVSSDGSVAAYIDNTVEVKK